MSTHKLKTKQSGMVMLMCMFFLVITMTLGAFAMRDITLSEKSAGNLMDKQRSMHAAESAIRYAEWWLSLNNHGEIKDCTGIHDGNNISEMHICNSGLLNPNDLPWETYTTYKPDQMIIDTAGGLNSHGDTNYQAEPILHIQLIGENRRGKYFQITAAGFGGQENTKTIIQTTYLHSVNSINLGGL
ncbi:hypothetical protein [Comamonas aquatica]|uniref:hypothetical protein n=1 Tax=Comamonas aquatica TaxID=225991 RepID=UPI0034D71254